MDYEVRQGLQPGIGAVEWVYVDGRRVGMVYRDPHPPEELDELWIAYTAGGHGVASREDGIREVLDYASANPDFELL